MLTYLLGILSELFELQFIRKIQKYKFSTETVENKLQNKKCQDDKKRKNCLFPRGERRS